MTQRHVNISTNQNQADESSSSSDKINMGRTRPSRGHGPSALRRDARSKRAKETLNVDIPTILKANPRAQKGVNSSELIVDPQFSRKSKSWKQKDIHADQEVALAHEEPEPTHRMSENPVSVRVYLADTFQAAWMLHGESKNSKVAVLNMASPLRPGGGFLTGAQAQEESLCMRSTLYPALSESFYRLPEVGAVYTEDILVFRGCDSEMKDLAKHEQFYIDVITAAMHRHPDVEKSADGKQRYANSKDRELAEAKMRKVLSILKERNITKVVLGAWGCGAYRNPLDEVIQLWKKVLLGSDTSNQSLAVVNSPVTSLNEWAGMDIIFAINQKPMAEAFAAGFEIDLETPETLEAQNSENSVDNIGNQSPSQELQQKIKEVEDQIALAQNPDLRARLEVVLSGLNAQLD